jgi:hypothetical protein
MTELKNGILVRFPLVQKRRKKSGYRVSFADFIHRKINEGLNIGYKCFVFEIADEDFNTLDFEINEFEKISLDACLEKGIRVALYIKGKRYLTSDSDGILYKLETNQLEESVNGFSFGQLTFDNNGNPRQIKTNTISNYRNVRFLCLSKKQSGGTRQVSAREILSISRGFLFFNSFYTLRSES